MKSMSREDAARRLASAGKYADADTLLADRDAVELAAERALRTHEKCTCEAGRRLRLARDTLLGTSEGQMAL